MGDEHGENSLYLGPRRPPNRLPELLTQLRTWLDLPDAGPTIASCAAAATVPLDGEEAAWLLNVAAPSAGKTEAVNLLDGVTDGRLNEITRPACSAGPAAKTRARSASSPASAATHWSPSGTCPACSPPATAAAGTKCSGCCGAPTTGTSPATSPRPAAPTRAARSMVRPANRRCRRHQRHRPVHRPRRRARAALAVRPAAERGLNSRRNAAQAARRAGVRESAPRPSRSPPASSPPPARAVARPASPTRSPTPSRTPSSSPAGAVPPCPATATGAARSRTSHGRGTATAGPAGARPGPRYVRARPRRPGRRVDDAPDRARLDASRPARRPASTHRRRRTEHHEVARTAGLHRHVAHRHCEDMAAVGVVDDLSEHDDNDHRWMLVGDEGDLIRKDRRAARNVRSHPPTPHEERER